MSDTETQTGPQTWRQRAAAALPIGIALTLIAGVWLAGAVWSFEEQSSYARDNGFHIPWLLPLVLDGMAVAMAAVSWAASLDARPAVFARIVTAVAVAASSASNGAWAWDRSDGDEQTVILAAGVPVVAMLAFEVLLSEVRRQVLRRRGQPGPVAITYPRLVRMMLSPWPTFTSWRSLVLKATDPAKSFGQQSPILAEQLDESDPGIQVARRLTQEMAAARQSIAPRVARLALAERELGVWPPAHVVGPRAALSAEPRRDPAAVPAVEPVGEPVGEPVVDSPREPQADSPKAAAAAQPPARRSVTTAVREPAQKTDDKKLRAAHARLTKRLGREPSGPELGEAAGVSKATANRWKRDNAPTK